MRRFVDCYAHTSTAHRGRLYEMPEYVLGRIRGEALALSECRPDSRWLRDQATIILGYVEAFGFYADGEFPWGHVVAILSRMRTMIVSSERLAAKINEGHPSVRQAA